MFLLRHLEELLYTRTHILIVIYICARAIDAIVYSYMVHVCVWLWHLDKTLNTLMHTHINMYTCARAIDVIVCGYMGHFRCGTRHSRQTQRQKVLHAASNGASVANVTSNGVDGQLPPARNVRKSTSGKHHLARLALSRAEVKASEPRVIAAME